MRWMNHISVSLATCILISASDQPVDGQEARVQNPIARVQSTQSQAYFAQPKARTVPRPQEADPARGGWSSSAPRLPGVAGTPNSVFSRSIAQSSAQRKLQSKVDTKLREYKSAKESKKKKEIEGEIRDLLSQQFDERLKDPKSRVESSRKRLDELKSQIENREDNADEIIDLRLKVLTHDVQGLGWGVGAGNHTWRTTTETIYMPNPNQVGGFLPVQRQRFYPAPPKAPSSLNSTYPGGPRAMPPNTTLARPATVANQEPLASGYRIRNKGIVSSSQKKSEDDKPSMHQLLSDYKKHVESDKDLRPIEKAMRSLLEEEFKKYQKQLSDSAERIEEQIGKLEKNLSERKKMKQSIVDLKLKTVINQANGLGF